MVVQIIQPLAHRQVEQSQFVCPDQVQMPPDTSAVPFMAQFAEREPLKVQRENAVPGESDTTLLLVLDDFPGGPTCPLVLRMAGTFP